MPIQVTSRNYATRNHTGGNTFLLANSGQIIIEKTEFITNFDFTSTASQQVLFLNNFQIQLIGGTWGTQGFVIGDTIALTGIINNGSGFAAWSATSYTISDIVNDILTVSTTLDPFSTGLVEGQLMPFNNGDNSNTAILIANSSRSAPESVELLHNIIPNPASGGSASLIDSEVNRFKALNVSSLTTSSSISMTQLGNKSGGTYISATLTRLADVSGKRKFRYELIYAFPYKFIDSTLDQPSIFAAINSVKPWFNLKCIPEENNPNNALTLTYSAQQGNVGWLNENYNQGVNNFTISDVVLTSDAGTPLNAIDYNQNTNFEITITAAANFLNKAELEFYIIPPTSDYKNKPDTNGKLIHLVNAYWNGTTVVVNQFGDVDIDDFTVSVATANTIILTGKIVPGTDFTEFVESLSTDERLLRLTATVESTGGDANENNGVTLTLKEGLLDKAPVAGGVYTDLDFQGFFNHSQELSGTAELIYDGCTEDDFLYRALFKLDSTQEYKSLTINMQVVRDSDEQLFNIFQRTINFNNYVTTLNGQQQINYVEQLNQFLDVPNRNELRLQLTGVTDGDLYQLGLTWSIMASWRYWITQNNALVDFFDSTLPNNGFNNEWMRYLREAGYSLRLRCTLTTPDNISYYWQTGVELQDYDDSADITTVITLFDQNDNLQTALLANQMMRVVATHTKIDAWDVDDSWAWVSVRPFESETNKRISSEWAWTSQNLPLRPLQTEDRLKVTFPTANVMVTECFVDTSMLDVENCTLVARAETPKLGECSSPFDYIFDIVDSYDDKEKPSALAFLLRGTDITHANVCCPECLMTEKDPAENEIKVYAFGRASLMTIVKGLFLTEPCCFNEYEAEHNCVEDFDEQWDELSAGLDGFNLNSLIPSEMNPYSGNDIEKLRTRLFASTSDEAVRWELVRILLLEGFLVQCNITTGVRTISNISE